MFKIPSYQFDQLANHLIELINLNCNQKRQSTIKSAFKAVQSYGELKKQFDLVWRAVFSGQAPEMLKLNHDDGIVPRIVSDIKCQGRCSIQRCGRSCVCHGKEEAKSKDIVQDVCDLSYAQSWT